MKGGKDEKVMGPLFPRLHVNDTEKGGPRAPPRNKMALYEQLSVPSQRLHSVPSTLPLPPHHTSNLVPSASSSQGGGHERSMFSSFYIPSSTPAHSAEKVHSHSSDGMNFNGGMEFGRKSIKNGSYKTSNPAGHILSTAECNSTRPHDFSNSKNSSGKQPAEEDDFRVPTYQHGLERGRLNTLQVYPEKSIAANSNSSSQLPNVGDKSLKWTKNTNLKSRLQGRNPSEQSPKEAVQIKHGTERTAFHPSVMERIAEASKHANVPSIDKWPSVSTNEHENSHTGNSRLGPQNSFGLLSENNIGAEGNSVEPRCLNDNGISEKKNASRVRSEIGSSASLGNSHRVPNDAKNCIKESEGKALGNVDRVDDESDTSMVDSISGLDISPDDVVGVIGQKHFWKARKAIVNQQRVFAVQVFELHRLINVQKLIAGSPDLLLENNPFLSRPPKVPSKKPTSEYSLKSQLQSTLQKDDFQKQSENTECPSLKDGSQKPCIPPLVDGGDKGLVTQSSNHGPYPGNIAPATPAADNNSNPWCFQQPGNQWLVPIMSPSEGLVYKPYMGPCPPNIGFMTPVYGNCGPLSLPPAPAYGVPASHQQPGAGVIHGAPMVPQNYYPPGYCLPVMNPMVSNPALEQVNPSAGAQPHQQSKQVSTREVNFNMHSRSSCNMSNQKSEAFSCCSRKLQTSKDSEVQGSTASSPCEMAQKAINAVEGRDGGDALPLFPVGPAKEGADLTPHVHSGDQHTRAIKVVSQSQHNPRSATTRAIKVVPHNPRSATESAARIFRSIQKERQQYDQ